MKILTKKSKVVVGIFVLILVIFLLNVYQKEIKNFFYWFSAPIQKVFFRTGESTADFFGGIIKIKNLKNELDELKLKNQELLAQIVALKELEKENEILREALKLELQKDFKLLLVQIISKDISQDFILIDKGFEDGISKNMPVITQQKVLMGKVFEVYKNFSKVMLISNEESSFDGKIQGEEKDISAVVKGQGNFRILFDFIPQEEEIFVGDIVVTSSLGGIFPKGLLVGQIKEIKKSDVEAFQQAEIEPAFDIRNLEFLFVIL